MHYNAALKVPQVQATRLTSHAPRRPSPRPAAALWRRRTCRQRVHVSYSQESSCCRRRSLENVVVSVTWGAVHGAISI